MCFISSAVKADNHYDPDTVHPRGTVETSQPDCMFSSHNPRLVDLVSHCEFTLNSHMTSVVITQLPQ